MGIGQLINLPDVTDKLEANFDALSDRVASLKGTAKNYLMGNENLFFCD